MLNDRRFWIAVAALVAVAVAFWIALVFQGLFGQITDKGNSGAAYAHDAAQAVASEWDKSALVNRATPVYAAALVDQDPAIWNAYEALGATVEISPCSMLGIDITNGVARGGFTCPAKFEHANAAIRVDLFELEGEWKVAGFGVLLGM